MEHPYFTGAVVGCFARRVRIRGDPILAA